MGENENVTTELTEKEKKQQRMRSVKRRRGPSKLYFTTEHQEAIVRYNQTSDPAEKRVLYQTLIQPALTQIIENIVNTFAFSYLPNIADKKRECLVVISGKLDKFDPGRNRKAFSFFSVCVKNWFLGQVKKYKDQHDREVSLDETLANTISQGGHDPHNFSREGLETNMDRREFYESFLAHLPEWDQKLRSDSNMYVVFQTVMELLTRDYESLPDFDRSSVRKYIQSRTHLTNGQIANALFRLRPIFVAFEKDWANQ